MANVKHLISSLSPLHAGIVLLGVLGLVGGYSIDFSRGELFISITYNRILKIYKLLLLPFDKLMTVHFKFY